MWKDKILNNFIFIKKIKFLLNFKSRIQELNKLVPQKKNGFYLAYAIGGTCLVDL
jgi:hypothetical protein